MKCHEQAIPVHLTQEKTLFFHPSLEGSTGSPPFWEASEDVNNNFESGCGGHSLYTRMSYNRVESESSSGTSSSSWFDDLELSLIFEAENVTFWDQTDNKVLLE